MAALSPGFSSTWPRLPNAGHQLSGRGERPQCFPDQLISASVLSDLGEKKPVCSIRALLSDALLVVFTQISDLGQHKCQFPENPFTLLCGNSCPLEAGV